MTKPPRLQAREKRHVDTCCPVVNCARAMGMVAVMSGRLHRGGLDGRASVAMIGTRGLPAQHGGFETCVEEVATRMVADGRKVTVYCLQNRHLREYRGVRRVYVPSIRSKSLETLSGGILAVTHACLVGRPTICILFNSALAPLIPILHVFRILVVCHPDGLEWRRSKWPRAIRFAYAKLERMAITHADGVIADAVALQRYYTRRYGVDSEYIAYGANEPSSRHMADEDRNLTDGRPYHLVVARFEPENHVREIVAGFTASHCPDLLVLVGSSHLSSGYEASVKAAADGDSRVIFLGPVYDQGRLDALYANAIVYWHGHSVGGTNPSLLRAVRAGTYVMAHENEFNREVLGDLGGYFEGGSSIPSLIAEEQWLSRGLSPEDVERGRLRFEATYNWDRVAASYGRLIDRIVNLR